MVVVVGREEQRHLIKACKGGSRGERSELKAVGRDLAIIRRLINFNCLPFSLPPYSPVPTTCNKNGMSTKSFYEAGSRYMIVLRVD